MLAPTRALVCFVPAARETLLAKRASRRWRLQTAKQIRKHVDASRTPLSLRLDCLDSGYGPTIETRFILDKSENGSRHARTAPTVEAEADAKRILRS